MSANTPNVIQIDRKPAEEWAKGFNSLEVFQQICTLHTLYEETLSLGLKLQILGLLNERVLNYYEDLSVAEKKIQEQISNGNKVKALTTKV